MMYSEVIGSFIRRTDLPLEANSVFFTFQDLKDYYDNHPEDEENLHIGNLKIVERDETNEDKQVLYWVAEMPNGNLGFKPLIVGQAASKDDVADILKILVLLIGDEDMIQALTDAPTDFNNFIKISNKLNEFFNTKSNSNKIETWLDLLDFLKDADPNKPLEELLEDLLKKIWGDPIPSEKFRTLRGIEDYLIKRDSEVDHALANLQTEINTTQTGVGLDSDGKYSADHETNFLKTATSVMNALKILDMLINMIKNEAVTNVQLVVKEI